jgi:hypothetical protein
MESQYYRDPGRLADAILVLSKSQKPVDIEIRNVTRFSYGELTNGDVAIWAEGKAGWFQIRPATQYTAMYEDMIQAVQLLYFVTDIYNEPRKRGGGPGVQLIFQEVRLSGRCHRALGHCRQPK